jgi:ABC-type lipoprotein export system ATPase subunit
MPSKTGIIMYTQKNILCCRHLYKSFSYHAHGKQHIIFSDLTYCFQQDKTYGIMGSSGVGKSTLLYLLSGLDTPDKGCITYNNHNINTYSSDDKHHFLQHDIALIFQQPHLIDELTVIENVMTKALIARDDYETSRKRAYELLDVIDLTSYADASPALLSGGQKQRIAVARALFYSPSFILADEPTAHLDDKNTEIILWILMSMHKTYNIGLIIASHDTRVSTHLDHVLWVENCTLVKK